MDLFETIKKDLISAFKLKDFETLSVLRLLDAAIKNKEIEKRTRLCKKVQDISELEKLSRLSEEELIGILMTEIKKRKESIAEFTKGKRTDLVKKEEKEIPVLKKYLPIQLSEEEITKEVKAAISEIKPSGQADFGKIMQILAPKLKGRAEGKIIAEIVKKELAELTL